MKTNAQIKEQHSINELSAEASKIIEILDKIEDHTANLRKKLMLELKPKAEAIRLDLDNI